VEWAGKPNSVPGWRPGGRSFVWADGHPPARAPYPQRQDSASRAQRPTGRAALRCLFGLAGGGVCPATTVTGRAVRSYRTISPLPAAFARDVGGIFSAALSLGSRRVGVTNHRALPSSDFPPGQSGSLCILRRRLPVRASERRPPPRRRRTEIVPVTGRSPRPLHRCIVLRPSSATVGKFSPRESKAPTPQQNSACPGHSTPQPPNVSNQSSNRA
jgi:hypothetical protein